ncbi:hypothetical protein ACLBWH_12170 [Sphingomonas sp. M6A6_1c]
MDKRVQILLDVTQEEALAIADRLLDLPYKTANGALIGPGIKSGIEMNSGAAHFGMGYRSEGSDALGGPDMPTGIAMHRR